MFSVVHHGIMIGVAMPIHIAAWEVIDWVCDNAATGAVMADKERTALLERQRREGALDAEILPQLERAVIPPNDAVREALDEVIDGEVDFDALLPYHNGEGQTEIGMVDKDGNPNAEDVLREATMKDKGHSKTWEFFHGVGHGIAHHAKLIATCGTSELSPGNHHRELGHGHHALHGHGPQLGGLYKKQHDD